MPAIRAKAAIRLFGNFSSSMIFDCLTFLHLIGSITSQMCYQTEAAFATDCMSTYGGIVNGGRCFYLASTTSWATWNDSWTRCAETGGTLAQIHTKNEFTDILNVTAICNIGICNGAWVALMRNPNAQLNQSGLVLNIQNWTFWYGNNMLVNSKLSSTNTWIGRYEQDNGFGQSQDCFSTYGFGVSDTACSASNSPPLCVVHNQIQNFTYVPNICMTTQIVETFLTNSTNDCAQFCSFYSNWCRSFNYYPFTKQCDLFSWYCMDTTDYVFSTNGCFHYAYSPHSSSLTPVCTSVPTLPPSSSPSPSPSTTTPICQPSPIIPTISTISSITGPNGKLNMTQPCLTSPSDIYSACVYADGNFVVSKGAYLMWSTQTSCQSLEPPFVAMQNDQNLCLYSPQYLWCAACYNKGQYPATATMQDDGNLVVNDANGTLLWSWQTGLIGSPGK